MTRSDRASTRRLVVGPLLDVPAQRVRDARGARVITPNREAARTLAVPAWTLEDAARRVLAERDLHVASPLLARRAIVTAAARRAGVADVPGFAAAAEGTLRELMRSGIDLEGLEHDESARVRRLAAVAAEVRSVLREEGRIDPADVFWRAAEILSHDPSPGPMAIVAGYPRLPVAERTFLDAWAGPGSEVHLPLHDHDALFDENRRSVAFFEDRGWRVERTEPEPRGVGGALALHWLGRPARTDAASAHAYADLDAEVRGTLGAVKRRLLDGTPADAIAVVARQEQAYGPALLAVADEYGVPFRVLYSVPVLETRFGSWLDDGLAAIEEGFLFEATARWLSDPVAGVLDPTLWPEARRTRPNGGDAWRALGVPMPDEAWPERGPWSGHVARLIGMLRTFDVERRCARWAREAAALHAFLDGLRDASLGPVEPDAETSFAAFHAEVRDLLSVLNVAADPGTGGVHLHTPLSLFGARVEHVYVVGAAEGQLPAPVRPDPLLDPFERARLRRAHPEIEDVRAQARREEMSFWAALQTATESLSMSWPKLTGRSETLPSPYLDRLDIVVEPPGPAPIGSEREFRRAYLAEDRPTREDPVLPHARHARAVELGRESEDPWGTYDGVTGIPYRVPERGVGVSRLIDMASCPFKFWATSVLYLREPEEAPTSLDPALRGSLYHDALHRALEHAVGRADVRAAALARLEEAFAGAERALLEDRAVDVSAFPNWPRDREDHLATLRRAIRSEAFLGEGAEVVALEADLRGAWQGIRVRGRIDRIDRTPEGAELIDYKTGGSVSSLATDEAGKAALDLQLPVYREASAELMRRVAPDMADMPRRIRYYSLTKAKPISARQPTPEEEAWIAAEVGGKFARGAFPVDPDTAFAACTYCPYDAVCRKGPRLERKRRSS